MPQQPELPSAVLSPTEDSAVRQFRDRVVSQRQLATRELVRFLHTIWLFTESDIKTIVLPSTIFGLVNAVALWLLLPESVGIPHPLEILARAPLIILYVWVNLVVIDIQNQRAPESIEEDRINKPTRPMPSGKVSPSEAGSLLVAFCIISVLTSTCLGAPGASIFLVFLSYIYSDVGAAEHPFFRNILNALGMPSFAVGALQVAINSTSPWAAAGSASAGPGFLPGGPWVPLLAGRWILAVSATIFSTISVQDLKDQAGDSARGRRTLPLVIGDGPARWVIAVPVVAWSAVLPWLWGCTAVLAFAPVATLGLVVAVRAVTLRSVPADKLTFKLWCLWLAVVYCLPLSRALTGGEGLRLLTL